MAIDNVRVFSNAVAVIQEAINSSNNDNVLLRNSETVHWFDPATNNVMGTIQNDAVFDYGCTTVEVEYDDYLFYFNNKNFFFHFLDV